MSSQKFDDLITRMPQIAKAVQAFTSESVQAQVLQSLLDALDAETPKQVLGTPDATGTGGSHPSTKVKAELAKKPGKPSKPTHKSKASFTIDKNLDLVKGGTKSFNAFIEERKPKSLPEKVLLSIYWLSRLASKPQPVSIDQVYTCFKHAGWPVPPDLRNVIHQAGTKGWLDSHTNTDLRVVIAGENHVEHDMGVK